MPRHENQTSFKPRKAPFSDPDIRAKALAARLANPRGKRGAHRYQDLPGLWTDHDTTTLGEKVGPKEKAALSQHFLEGMTSLDDLTLRAARVVLEDIILTVGGGSPLTVPQANFLGKLLDKKAPDLRADTRAAPGQVTRFVIGAPLARLVERGATIAGEITETPVEEPEDGAVSEETADR